MNIKQACEIIYNETDDLQEAIQTVKYYRKNILDLEDYEIDMLSEVTDYLFKKGWL